MKTVRCAVYTRKSSEEGLEQSFNSLDAQREACSAYILSQASEGWALLPTVYDDGGLSGGTLKRPALQRLLTDIAAGKIDIVVVYKVDRLSRSLLDFAKLVEAFDQAGTSFVSITQSFNTTTSMGRLTLNMLLSFAQFEREVTAERIRDKIAASKAKGMWMGGVPPVGYEADGRSLKIIEPHAAVIRLIFERYLALGNVRLVLADLEREGVTTPVRVTASGRQIGGVPFSRGQIYNILNCAIYVGQVVHRGQAHAGLHAAIIDQGTWARTRAKLADQLQGSRRGDRRSSASLLAGRVFDAEGRSLFTSHACKGSTRYRYYVSRPGPGAVDHRAMRIPAAELDGAVSKSLTELFDDPVAIAARASLIVQPWDFSAYAARCAGAASAVRRKDLVLVQDVVAEVRIQDSGIEICCLTEAIASALRVKCGDEAPRTVVITSQVQLRRTGLAMRLVQANGRAALPQPVDPSLAKLLVKAQGWWSELRKGELDVSSLAARDGVSGSYITRALRLAFLAPAVVEGILERRTLASVSSAALTVAGAVPSCWTEQERLMLPATCLERNDTQWEQNANATIRSSHVG